MWWDWSYWPMPHFFFGPLFMIAFFAICMIMMWMMGGHRRGGDSALDILSERYARGELIKPNTKNGGACCAREAASPAALREIVRVGIA